MKHLKPILFALAVLLFTVSISAQQQQVKMTEGLKRLRDEELER